MIQTEKSFHIRPGMLAIFILAICIGSFFPAARSVAEVRNATERSREEADRETEVIRLMNLNLRYLLNDWWYEEKGYAYASTTNFNDADCTLTEEQRIAVRKSAQAFADWRNAEELPVLYLSEFSNSLYY